MGKKIRLELSTQQVCIADGEEAGLVQVELAGIAEDGGGRAFWVQPVYLEDGKTLDKNASIIYFQEPTNPCLARRLIGPRMMIERVYTEFQDVRGAEV